MFEAALRQLATDDPCLFVWLGCATESSAQAALANALQAIARFDLIRYGSVAVEIDHDDLCGSG